MRFEITRTFGKLLTAVALAVILAGTTFALPSRQVEKKEFGKSFKWEKNFERFEKRSLDNFKNGDVSEINQANFLLGHYLMRTIYDAYFAQLEEGELTQVAEDIQVLLKAFEGSPSQAQLEGLLKSVNDGTADVKQIVEIINGIEKVYRADLSEVEDWFLLYGEWTTCLIGDTHLENDEYIYEDLAALKEVAANAPEEASEQIIKPVGALSRFAEQDSFSAADYEEILSNACNIFDLVFGVNL